MTELATSDRNHLKRQILHDEHAILFQKLKKVAPALLLNRHRAQLMRVHRNANLANGLAGLNAALLAAVGKCPAIDPATAQKVFQNRNAKITDSVKANLLKSKTAIPTSRALLSASSVTTGLHGVLAQQLAVLVPVSARRNATANLRTNAMVAKFLKVQTLTISSRPAIALTRRALAGATGRHGANVQTDAVLTRERGNAPVFARTKTVMRRTISSRKSAQAIPACGPVGQNGASALAV